MRAPLFCTSGRCKDNKSFIDTNSPTSWGRRLCIPAECEIKKILNCCLYSDESVITTCCSHTSVCFLPSIRSLVCKYMIWKIAVLDMDRKNIMFIFRLRWSNPTDSALNHHLASGCECSRHLQLARRGHPSEVADLRLCLMITAARKLLFEWHQRISFQ